MEGHGFDPSKAGSGAAPFPGWPGAQWRGRGGCLSSPCLVAGVALWFVTLRSPASIPPDLLQPVFPFSCQWKLLGGVRTGAVGRGQEAALIVSAIPSNF